MWVNDDHFRDVVSREGNKVIQITFSSFNFKFEGEGRGGGRLSNSD